MSDIVDRLRRYFPAKSKSDGKLLCDEGAAEIERLRARVALLTGLLIELDAHEGAEGWSEDLNTRLIAALAQQEGEG